MPTSTDPVDENSYSSGAQKVLVVTTSGEPLASASPSLLDSYKLSRVDVTSDPTYTLSLNDSGNWVINRVNLSAGTSMYVKGDSGFTTAWTNRVSQTYVEYDELF